MLRQKRPKSAEEQLQEAARIELLMAGGWSNKSEIAKGLGVTPGIVDRRLKSATGKTFRKRGAEIARELIEASGKAGRSIGQVYVKKGADDAGDEKAARVAEVGRLLAAGWKGVEIASGLGLTVSGFEKFRSATGISIRAMEAKIALEVTEASVRAGRPTRQILDQLRIDETTLHKRLRRSGAHLGGIEKRIKDELEGDIRHKIGRIYEQEWGRIPEDAVGQWRRKCGWRETEELPLHVLAFHHLMEGRPVERFIAEAGVERVKAVGVVKAVRPAVDGRRHFIARKIYGILETPAVTEKQRKVFRLIAVEDLTYETASHVLHESSAGITAIKKALIKKFPQLAGLLKYHENTRET